MEPIRFTGQDPVLETREGEWPRRHTDIPAPHVPALRGLKQQRVRGTLGGVDFASNMMPARGGRLALSVSTAMMSAAGVAIGDEAEFEITGICRE